MLVTTHVAREQITVSGTAVTLTAATVTAQVVYGEIQVQAYQIRVTFDGSTAPVAATTGELWNPGDIKRIWGSQNLQNLKFIQETSSDATLVVNYWGRAA